MILNHVRCTFNRQTIILLKVKPTITKVEIKFHSFSIKQDALFTQSRWALAQQYSRNLLAELWNYLQDVPKKYTLSKLINISHNLLKYCIFRIILLHE